MRAIGDAVSRVRFQLDEPIEGIQYLDFAREVGDNLLVMGCGQGVVAGAEDRWTRPRSAGI